MWHRRFLFMLPVLLLGCLLILLFLGLVNVTRDAPHSMVGQSLPEIALPLLGASQDTAGNEQKDTHLTNALFNGNYALINVFGSWCGACLMEHPVLTKFAQFFPVYGLAWRDKDEDTTRWLAAHGNPYRAVGMDRDGVLAAQLGVSGAPTSFVIDAQGTVIFVLEAPLTDAIIVSEILPLFMQKVGAGDAGL